MSVNEYTRLKKNVHEIIRDKIVSKYNEQRLSCLKKGSTTLTLCVGSGISADVNRAVNDQSYLWNGLVYGIAGELLAEYVSSDEFIQHRNSGDYPPERSISDVKEYCKVVSEAIAGLVGDQKFLNSESTMECVEYLKYLAFLHENGTIEECYAENVMALITHKLLNYRRKNDSDPVVDEIRTQISKSYIANKYVKGQGYTLVEVAKLLCRMYAAQKDKINHIDVLTYNYDDFLEVALNTLDPNGIACESIYNDKTQSEATNSGIYIYHVHGFIPQTWDESCKNGEFIFSENSYSHISDDIYHWTNRVQADIFAKKRVLFVGFSGVDTNFRRLMKEIKKERMRIEGNYKQANAHIMFMSYASIIDQICTDKFFDTMCSKLTSALSEVVAAEMIRSIIDAKDSYYMDQLGIELLWYHDVSEIPDMINAICSDE